MRTFLTLLKKELRELLTWQIILPILLTAVLFFGLGNVLGKEQQKANAAQAVVVLDRDNSPATELVHQTLVNANFKVINATEGSPADLIAQARTANAQLVIIIPKGFGSGLNQNRQQQLETYSLLQNFSLIATRQNLLLDNVFSTLNSYFSAQQISLNSRLNAAVTLQPIVATQHVALGDRIADGSAQSVLDFISTQTTYIPIILFFVIVFAGQMIATAVASEKENKTIETLLTMPIKRSYIVTTKMLAAGIIALLASAVYMAGFHSYMTSLTGGTSVSQLSQGAVQALGLQFTPLSYAILGVSLFMGILVALAIAMILGAFAEDVKSVQGLLTPLILLVMVPYIITLFLDMSTMSPALRDVIYLIPFSHSFLAGPHLLLQQPAPVFWGIAYQALWFIIFTWIAAKIFTTDRIITLKINFRKQKHHA